MIELTARLKATAEYVRHGSVVADIGTDHAYVPVYLIQNGIISKAYAGDINEGPLQNARKTIEENCIEGITLLQSDGLEKISPHSVDDIVIAGMGGELIFEILKKVQWCKNKKYNFSLQPMTREEELRKNLYREGYAIKDETLVREKDKLYTVMNVSYTGVEKDISDVFSLLGFSRCNKLFEEKKSREICRLQKIYEQLNNKENSADEQEKIKKLVEEIRVY